MIGSITHAVTEAKRAKILRTKEAYRTQAVNAIQQIDSEPRLRRIAQFVSSEWTDEKGGLMINDH